MSMKRPGRRTQETCVSLSPSKIPYVGFSPVRLQTRRQARPSSTDLYAPQAGPTGLYGRKRQEGETHSNDPSSRGPWLANEWCCLVGSWLTMASSEPLAASCRLMNSTTGLCCRRSREGPQFIPRVCPIVPSLHPGGPNGRIWLSRHRSPWPSPSSHRLGIRSPARSGTSAACHEAP